MRFNLSFTEVVILGTAFSAIVAWGVSVESRAGGINEMIQKKVEEEVAKAVKPFISSVVPSGGVVAYLGTNAAAPDGWEICGRSERKFPSLEGRFLVGTHHLDKVGTAAGSREHDHSVSIRSSVERDGKETPHPEGADNRTGAPNWSHKHHVEGATTSAAHIPPAIQVMFFCKL